MVCDDIESCVVEVRSLKRILYIVAIYRPPSGSFDSFCEVLISILNSHLLVKKK